MKDEKHTACMTCKHIQADRDDGNSPIYLYCNNKKCKQWKEYMAG